MVSVKACVSFLSTLVGYHYSTTKFFYGSKFMILMFFKRNKVIIRNVIKPRFHRELPVYV